jgi:TIR domain
MRRWFLSYHSPDEALAERLKAALESKDIGTRVFFAPSSLRAGGFWSKVLAEEIAQADAFILLVGEKGVGDWQVLEYDEALDKRAKLPDFPVILVLLEGQTAPGLPFLRRLHWIITPDPSSEKDVARLLDAAAGTGTRLGELWRYTSPYRGLAAMEEKDSDYFFGRERKTVDVISALIAAADRLMVLLGNSGVGKSSLAQAGILAALFGRDCQIFSQREVTSRPSYSLQRAAWSSAVASECAEQSPRNGVVSVEHPTSAARISSSGRKSVVRADLVEKE